jgi:hypothetical protein
LNNKTANSKWVAKAVVNKMRTSEKVRIQDIIQDTRRNYSLGDYSKQSMEGKEDINCDY